MAYDLRKISSLGDEQSWTSSIQKDRRKRELFDHVNDDNDEHFDSVEVTLDSASNSRERSDLSLSYSLRKVLSREPEIDSKEAQPLSCQYEKPEIQHDDHAEHAEVVGGALVISAAADAGQAALDRAYNMRKAKSCPSPLHEDQRRKKKGLFGRKKNSLAATRNDSNRIRKDGKLAGKIGLHDDESTQCITAANSADNSYFTEELQDKSEKRRCDPWVITLIVLVCLILGMGAFAGSYFLPDMLENAENKHDYEEIVEIEYTPTDISISPSSGVGTSITFYAMADAPYTDHERENIMPYQIRNLSSSAEFLIHLGDLQYAAEGCQEHSYQAASDILKQSSIPVFVIPGGKVLSAIDFS
jgi:hypothetical protein